MNSDDRETTALKPRPLHSIDADLIAYYAYWLKKHLQKRREKSWKHRFVGFTNAKGKRWKTSEHIEPRNHCTFPPVSRAVGGICDGRNSIRVKQFHTCYPSSINKFAAGKSSVRLECVNLLPSDLGDICHSLQLDGEWLSYALRATATPTSWGVNSSKKQI